MSLDQMWLQAWAKQSRWLYLFKPVSLLYSAIIKIRHSLYQQQILTSYRAPVPVMIIGNITVGGSGKTPLIIALVKFLQHQGIKVAVISRGYGGLGPFPRLVNQGDGPNIVGDEPVLIVQETGVLMAVGPNRQAAIELILQQQQPDLILSDDGLQHLALERDLEWVVVDIDRGLGNEQLLPVGFLREPISRLQGTTVIEHGKHPISNLHMQLKAGKLIALNPLNNPMPVAGDTVHAVAGIGVPSRFFQSLRDLGFKVIEHAFADHYDYQAADLNFNDGLAIITTAKDAVKIHQLLSPLAEQSIWILPVEAQLSPAVYALLMQQLTALNIKHS